MKKFILTIFIVTVVVISSKAEDSKMWLGGGVGLDFVANTEGDNSVSFGVAPEFGYKINNHWAIAGELGYNISNSYGDKSNTFIIGPYVRYTFFDNNRLSFFGEFAFHYAHIDSGWEADGMEFILRPGMLVKLNEKWSLTGKINLFEYAYIEEASAVGVHITTGLSIGFIYNF